MRYLQILIISILISISIKSQSTYLLSPKGLNERAVFGISVARCNNYLLFGSQLSEVKGKRSGSVYVYKKTPDGYKFINRLTSQSPEEDEWFGLEISVSGNTLAVGTRNDDIKAYNAGSVHIYDLSNDNFQLDTIITASDAEAFASFGRVGLENSTLVVGAELTRFKGKQTGAIYIYEKIGGYWKEIKKFSPPDLTPLASFANMVIKGNTIIVGAHKDQLDKGSVYVFRKDNNGEWELTSKIFAPDGIPGDLFGHTLSSYAQYVLIGADKESTGNLDTGAAYLYEDTGKFLKFIQKFTPPDGNSGDRFGSMVLVYKNSIYIGAKNNNNVGAVYQYENTGSSWTFTRKITPPHFQKGMSFGDRMYIDDELYIISATGYDNTQKDQGAVYIYNNDKYK